MSPYLVTIPIFEFFITRLAMLPYGHDSLLPNYYPAFNPRHLYLYYYANCILYFFSIKIIIIIIMTLAEASVSGCGD